MSTRKSRNRQGHPQFQPTERRDGIRAEEVFERVPLIVEIDMIAYRWLEAQSHLCGLEPTAVLALLADIGRNMLEHDQNHVIVLEVLKRAGFTAVRSTEGFYYDPQNGTIVRQ